MAVSAIDVICPHCGYIDIYFNPSKFPICECCSYEDPIILDNQDVLTFEKEIKIKKPNVDTYEALREKYVYPSEHFSKKAYNDMLKYSEEKKKRIQMPHLRQYQPAQSIRWCKGCVCGPIRYL